MRNFALFVVLFSLVTYAFAKDDPNLSAHPTDKSEDTSLVAPSKDTPQQKREMKKKFKAAEKNAAKSPKSPKSKDETDSTPHS